MNEKIFKLQLIIICALISCRKNSSTQNPPPVPAEIPAENTPKEYENNSGTNTNNGNSGDELPDGLNTLKPLSQDGVPDGYSSWTELNQIDPKTKNLLTLKGEDPVSALLGEDPACEVYVLAHYLDKAGKETFALRTSFNHNGDTHAFLLASMDPSATSAIAVDAESESQAFFKLGKAGDLLSSVSMNLKWFHINHFDTGMCENLQIKEKN